MRYHHLYVADPVVQKHVLWAMDRVEQRMKVRPMYADLCCPACGRLEEFAAIRQRGLPEKLRISSKRDVCGTFDHCTVVNSRFREGAEQGRIKGLEFHPLPASPDRWMLIPQYEARTVAAESGMQFIGEPCERCGRYQESLYCASFAAMELPEDPMVMFMPQLRAEKTSGRMAAWVASDAVVSVLKQHKITGFDWAASLR